MNFILYFLGKPLEEFDQEGDIISDLRFKRTTLATDCRQDCKGREWEQRG